MSADVAKLGNGFLDELCSQVDDHDVVATLGDLLDDVLLTDGTVLLNVARFGRAFLFELGFLLDLGGVVAALGVLVELGFLF
jgi:hypothetical protein